MSDSKAPFLERFITFILVLSPSLIALGFFTDFSRAFEFPKAILLSSLTLFVAGLAVLQVLINGKKKWIEKRFSNPIALTVLALMTLIFVASIMSPQRLINLWGSYERGMGMIQWLIFGLYFLMGITYLSRESIKKALNLLLMTGSFISLYGLAQKLGVDPFFGSFNVDFLEGRVFSTMGNPDFLAQLLAPLLGLALYFFYESREKKFLLYSLFLTPGLILSESRASVLALMIGLAFFVFLQVKIKKKYQWTALVGVFTVAVFALGIHMEWPFFDRLSFTEENFRSVYSRLLIWKAAALTILDYPIFGIGPDNFGNRFLEYINSDFYYLEESFHISADRAHNETLQMGLIGGIPLLLTYLWLNLKTVKIAFKGDYLLKGLGLYTLIVFLQNQLTFSQITHFTITFFLLAAVVVLSTKGRTKTWKPTRLFRSVGSSLLLVFLLFSFGSVVVKKVYAEAWYTYALVTDDTKQGLETAMMFDPYQAAYRYNYLMWFPEERWGQIQILEALEGPTIDVLAWKATGLSAVDAEASYEAFEQVIELNPNYAHTQRAYADALFRNGEYARAAQQYEVFLEIAPDFWSWCPDLDSYSAYEQKKHRIFYKNVSDFNNSLIHLYDSYNQINESEKAAEIYTYISCEPVYVEEALSRVSSIMLAKAEA